MPATYFIAPSAAGRRPAHSSGLAACVRNRRRPRTKLGAFRGGPMSTTLVRNGTIVTASDRYQADIYIDKGVITLIGQGLNLPAETLIDASGKLVMPGGIDVHTHLDMPFGGTTSA